MGAEVDRNPYCTGRSTAGNGVCVCVCLHLLVIGRRREGGGKCPLLALMKELSGYHKETRGQSRMWSGHNQTWYKVWTTDSHEVCVCVHVHVGRVQ